nr:MAG TPA: hypothetical protein [Caudoviricetes sp.]
MDCTHPVIIQVQTKYPKTHKVSMLTDYSLYIFGLRSKDQLIRFNDSYPSIKDSH